MYQAKRTSRSEFVPIRNLQYHVRIWGEPAPGKVPLVMVHGWMDVSASYQFVVDAFARDHYVIAPDWRGYGLTQLPEMDNYWFPDYLADLDWLLGIGEPRRFLVVLQNPFELRPTGGFMGLICVLRVVDAQPGIEECRTSEARAPTCGGWPSSSRPQAPECSQPATPARARRPRGPECPAGGRQPRPPQPASPARSAP